MTDHSDDSPDLEQVRAVAESVLERARADSAYLAQLVDDPAATLVAAGLDERAAQRVGLEEWNYGTDDVEGHMMSRPRPGPMTCDGITCWVTWCGLIPATNV